MRAVSRGDTLAAALSHLWDWTWGAIFLFSLRFDLLVILIVFSLSPPSPLPLPPFLCMPPGSADEISGDGNTHFHIPVTNLQWLLIDVNVVQPWVKGRTWS